MGSDLPESSEGSTQLDRLFTALAADDRRAVLGYFHSSGDDVASIEDLAEFLCARDGQPNDQDQIALMLHHATLPKLAELGLLDYDARTKTVQYHGHPVVNEWWDHDIESGEVPLWRG